MKTVLKLVAMALVIAIGSSCVTLPDIKPFADKTAEMANALSQGYTLVEGLLAETEGGQANVQLLKKRWELTQKALTAAVAYADALAALADAGQKGGESADALINSINGLKEAVEPIIGITAAIPDNVISAFRLINEVVAKLRARKALKEAVAQAKAAVNAIAQILSLNFKSLVEISQLSAGELLSAHAAANRPLNSYHTSLMEADAGIGKILSMILDYKNPNKSGLRAANLAALTSADRAFPAEIEKARSDLPNGTPEESVVSKALETRQAYWSEQAKYVREERDRIAPDYDKYVAYRVSIQNRMKTSALVFEKGSQAIEIWAKTHAALEASLNSKQRVTVLELATIVKEILETLQQGAK